MDESAVILTDLSCSRQLLPSPVIIGRGVTGMAISRALCTAGVAHVLIGDRPSDAPRLGESLNAEESQLYCPVDFIDK